MTGTAHYLLEELEPVVAENLDRHLVDRAGVAPPRLHPVERGS